ncbi:MAG: hypothetical protein WA126_13670 [Thermodesulfovibrionales bacterium]
MARKPKTKKEDADSYRHEDETRKNALPVGLSSYDTSRQKPIEDKEKAESIMNVER